MGRDLVELRQLGATLLIAAEVDAWRSVSMRVLPVPVQNSDTSDTRGATDANSASGVTRTRPAAWPVVGRFTVRVYDDRHVEAWSGVRAELGRRLGRIQSASEVAEVAARVLLDVDKAQGRAVELLRRQ